MPSEAYFLEFFRALFLTLLAETTILFLIIRSSFKIPATKLSTQKLLLASCVASGLTLPCLWFILPALIHDYTVFLTIGELSVFLVEAVIYFFVLRVSPKKALFLSFTCNLISFLLGLLMQNLLH